MVKKINSVFCQVFRSVTLILGSTEDEKLAIPINVILDWLSRYDSWWTKTTGISKGKNLHLLYGRYVTCIGSRLLRFVPELTKIASLSSRIGCIFALGIDFNELVERRNQFKELIDGGNLGELSIDSQVGNKKYQSSEYLSLIEIIIKSGISLNLVGPLDFWKELGILDSPIINSSSFRIIPSSNMKMRHTSQIVLADSAIGKENRKNKTLVHEFNPCSERFQIYVAPDGTFYPCKGLIGISSCILGTIYDSIENTVLAGSKETILDFRNLSESGPRLQFDNEVSNVEGLPPICFSHRNSIIETKNNKFGLQVNNSHETTNS